MNYLDIILAIPLVWGIFRGFRKGLVIEIASLIAALLGVWGAVHFSYFISDALNLASPYSPLISFAITFVIIVIIVFLIAKLIEKYNVPKNMYEFQMLYGVTPDMRKTIVDKGHTMRVYVPYGKDWFNYSTRRLRENPSMIRHMIKALFIRG